eukprot:9404539-Pyramimonas_sp.AAC.1
MLLCVTKYCVPSSRPNFAGPGRRGSSWLLVLPTARGVAGAMAAAVRVGALEVVCCVRLQRVHERLAAADVSVHRRVPRHVRQRGTLRVVTSRDTHIKCRGGIIGQA